MYPGELFVVLKCTMYPGELFVVLKCTMYPGELYVVLKCTMCPGELLVAGLEITAGQRTMSGLNWELTGQPFVLPVMLTGHI